MGRIDKDFHFLGIHYLGTQPSNNTNVHHLDEKDTFQNTIAHCLPSLGGRQVGSILRIRWASVHSSTSKDFAQST